MEMEFFISSKAMSTKASGKTIKWKAMGSTTTLKSNRGRSHSGVEEKCMAFQSFTTPITNRSVRDSIWENKSCDRFMNFKKDRKIKLLELELEFILPLKWKFSLY